jgi:addiction module HigA family antidote
MVDSRVNEFDPDFVSTPGETLLEILQARGMAQSELAARTGRTSKLINEIVMGKATITSDTAIQLERALGIPAGFWNNRQQRHSEFLARSRESKALQSKLQWAKRFPYRKMANLGWIDQATDKLVRFRNILDFFAVASPEAWNQHYEDRLKVAYRVSRTQQPDQYALAAWLRQGEIVGSICACAPYSTSRFREVLSEIRALTTKPPSHFQAKVVELCAKSGVVVAFVRELPRTASGATRWLSPEKALLQLSLKYKTDDHLWFTFFHEAAHILHHKRRSIFIEGGKSTSTEEMEADKFASDFLIPPQAYNELVQRRLSCSCIEAFAAEIGIAPGIIVGRLQHDNRLAPSRCNHLKRRLKWV